MNDSTRIELLRPVRLDGQVVEPGAEMTLPLPTAAALVHGGKARYLPSEPRAAVTEDQAPASDPVVD